MKTKKSTSGLRPPPTARHHGCPCGDYQPV